MTKHDFWKLWVENEDNGVLTVADDRTLNQFEGCRHDTTNEILMNIQIHLSEISTSLATIGELLGDKLKTEE